MSYDQSTYFGSEKLFKVAINIPENMRSENGGRVKLWTMKLYCLFVEWGATGFLSDKYALYVGGVEIGLYSGNAMEAVEVEKSYYGRVVSWLLQIEAAWKDVRRGVDGDDRVAAFEVDVQDSGYISG